MEVRSGRPPAGGASCEATFPGFPKGDRRNGDGSAGWGEGVWVLVVIVCAWVSPLTSIAGSECPSLGQGGGREGGSGMRWQPDVRPSQPKSLPPAGGWAPAGVVHVQPGTGSNVVPRRLPLPLPREGSRERVGGVKTEREREKERGMEGEGEGVSRKREGVRGEGVGEGASREGEGTRAEEGEGERGGGRG